MSKTFGKLFGDAKPSTVATSTTPFNNLPGFAQDAWKQALTSVQNLSSDVFTPAALTPEQQQAIGYFNTPTQTITPEQFNSGISLFSNPFEEQVLQNTFRDINEQGRGSLSDIASFASDIGGFGSNRRGLLEAELQKNILKTIGDISATSRAANFENAADRTLAEIGNIRNLDLTKMGSLFDIGSLIQDQNTATKNAPALYSQFLASLAQGVPTSSGSLGTYQNPGLIPRISSALQSSGKLAGQIGGMFA